MKKLISVLLIFFAITILNGCGKSDKFKPGDEVIYTTVLGDTVSAIVQYKFELGKHGKFYEIMTRDGYNLEVKEYTLRFKQQ